MAQDSPQKKHRQNTVAWIAALAIAVTLCAFLFLVFAIYLSSIDKNLAVTNARLATMQENEIQLLKEIQSLHQKLDIKNAP